MVAVETGMVAVETVTVLSRFTQTLQMCEKTNACNDPIVDHVFRRSISGLVKMTIARVLWISSWPI